MNTCMRIWSLRSGQFLNLFSEILSVPLHNSFLRTQTPPKIRMRKTCNQSIGCFYFLMLFRNDPIDTPQSNRFIQLTLGRLTPEIGSEETLVLNHSPVKINHIETTIGSHRCIDRTETFIRTGKKFPLFPNRIGIELMNIFIRCGEWFFGKKRTHRVSSGRHRENSTFPFLAIRSMTVYRQTTYGRDAGNPAVLQNTPGPVIPIKGGVWTDTEHTIGRRLHTGAFARPLTVISRPVHFEPVTICIKIQAPISITGHAPLAPGFCRHLDQFPFPPRELAGRLRIVHPVIQGIMKGVFCMLNITVGSGGKIDELFPFITSKVSILVLTQPQSTRLNHQYSTFNESNTSNINHIINEGSRLVHNPVLVRIFQYHHPAHTLVFSGSIQIAHVGS